MSKYANNENLKCNSSKAKSYQISSPDWVIADVFNTLVIYYRSYPDATKEAIYTFMKGVKKDENI